MNDKKSNGLEDIPESYLPQRVWTEEEIEDLKNKAKLENEMKEEDIDKPIPFEISTEIETKRQKVIEQLTLISLEEAQKVLEWQKIAAQWRKLFISLFAIFLVLEGAWILLYLLVNL